MLSSRYCYCVLYLSGNWRRNGDVWKDNKDRGGRAVGNSRKEDDGE